MQSLDVDGELVRLYSQSQMLRFQRLQSLKNAFPDLEIVVDPRGRNLNCSTEENRGATSVDFVFSEDSLLAYVYVSLPLDGRLYASPPCFTVGHLEPRSFGVRPVADWREQLQAANAHPDVIKKVDSYLRSRPPVSYREDA